MTVYVELVFLENFIIDYFLLLLSAKITCSPCKHPVLAALFGGIYACVLPLWNVLALNAMKATSLCAMVIICFLPKTLFEGIKNVLATACSACALFGVVNLFAGDLIQYGMVYSADGLLVLVLTGVFFSVVLYKGMLFFLNKRRLKENKAVFTVGDNSLNGIIDTGNSLYYKDIPVVLVEKSAIKQTEEILGAPVIIPYNSVGKSGAFIGFKPHKAFLTYNEKTVELNCVVALCEQSFSGNFSALLHPDLIREIV